MIGETGTLWEMRANGVTYEEVQLDGRLIGFAMFMGIEGMDN